MWSTHPKNKLLKAVQSPLYLVRDRLNSVEGAENHEFENENLFSERGKRD